MKYNVFEMAETLNNAESINERKVQDLMDFEHSWKDNYASEYNNDDIRCLDHLENMINGKLKEIIFNKYLGKGCCIKYKEEPIDILMDNADRKHIGETDFYDYVENKDVELKAYDQKYLTNDEIKHDLSRYNVWLKYYHKADYIYFWFPARYCIKMAYKVGDNWWVATVTSEDKGFECLPQMTEEYNRLRCLRVSDKLVK